MLYPRANSRWCGYGAVLAHGRNSRHRHRERPALPASAAAPGSGGLGGLGGMAAQYTRGAALAEERRVRDVLHGDDRPALPSGAELTFDTVGAAALTDGCPYNFLLHAWLQVRAEGYARMPH